jgi:hypothetical protein
METRMTDGMAWVNFNFKYLSEAISNCQEELEIDMYSTIVTASGTLVGTFLARYLLDTFIVPWWIRRRVRGYEFESMCLCVCVCARALCPVALDAQESV